MIDPQMVGPTPQQVDRDLIPLMGIPAHLIFPLCSTRDYNALEYPKAVQNVNGDWVIFTDALKWRKFSPSTSRDDLAEVLAKLTEEQWEAVVRDIALDYASANPNHQFRHLIRFCLTATPAQIALAVWRAVCQ